MATDSGQSVTTVDGVEPSIEVRYVGNATREDNNEVINLFNDDNGAPRSLIRGGDPVLVTEDELRQLEAQFQIERVEDADSQAAQAQAQQASSAPSQSPPSSTPAAPGASSGSQNPTTPGQSG